MFKAMHECEMRDVAVLQSISDFWLWYCDAVGSLHDIASSSHSRQISLALIRTVPIHTMAMSDARFQLAQLTPRPAR